MYISKYIQRSKPCSVVSLSLEKPSFSAQERRQQLSHSLHWLQRVPSAIKTTCRAGLDANHHPVFCDYFLALDLRTPRAALALNWPSTRVITFPQRELLW